MKLSKFFTVIFLTALLIFSCKKESVINNELNEIDNEFILFAGPANKAEIETSKIAVLKTTDSAILAYAKGMITEHTKANIDLKTMGTIVGFTVKDTLDASHAAMISQLNTLTDRSFDSTYIYMQSRSHDSTISVYRRELEKGNQMNVKAYANFYLPSLILHKQLADTIAKRF